MVNKKINAKSAEDLVYVNMVDENMVVKNVREFYNSELLRQLLFM